MKTRMRALICRIFWHIWRPAGWHYRVCERCGRIGTVDR